MTRPPRPAHEWRDLGVAVLVLGLFAAVMPLVAYWHQVRTLASDRREVAGLTSQLDSVRAEWQRDTLAATSGRLRSEIQQREYLLGRRSYHVVWRSQAVAGWWRPWGPGLGGTVGGIGLILIGLALRRHARRLTASRSAPPAG